MNKQRKLHPVAIFIMFINRLKSFIIPIIFSFFIGGTTGHPIFNFLNFILVLIIFTVIYSVLYWLTFFYEIHEGELKIRSGVLIKKVRYIHRERVHSIDLSAGILQRWFRLVKVKIETAGGGAEPEVYLIAVEKSVGEELRATILNKVLTLDRNQVENSEIEIEDNPVEKITWSITYRELLIAAVTSSGVGIVFSAMGVVFTQVEPLLPEHVFYDTVFVYFFNSSLYHLFLGILIILILAWIISILLTIIRYGNFTITKITNEIKIVRGLIEKRELTINEDRITAVRIVSSIFRQPFGYCSVYIESGGGGTKEEELSTVLFPIVKTEDVEKLISFFLPKYSTELCLESIPRRAWLRYQFRLILVPTVIIISLSFFISIAWYFLLSIPFLCLLAYWQHRDAGIGNNDQLLFLQYRKLNKNLVIFQRSNIQATELQASVMQRIRGLATIQVSILSSIIGKSFAVYDIDKSKGDFLLEWYSYKKHP